MEPGGVRALRVRVEELPHARALAPIGPHQDPGAGRNPPALLFPGQDVFRTQQEIGILRDLWRHIDDAGRPDEALHRDGITGVVRQVFAGDPVHGSVEVRARVLAQVEGVPVPGRSPLVVPREDFDRQARRGGEERGQLDHRRVRPQGLGEIDDLQAAGYEVVHQAHQDLRHGNSP